MHTARQRLRMIGERPEAPKMQEQKFRAQSRVTPLNIKIRHGARYAFQDILFVVQGTFRRFQCPGVMKHGLSNMFCDAVACGMHAAGTTAYTKHRLLCLDFLLMYHTLDHQGLCHQGSITSMLYDRMSSKQDFQGCAVLCSATPKQPNTS